MTVEAEDGAGITVESATVTYRNGHIALVDASFAVPTGTITALVGMNGSGKSTLFKAIMGFVPVSRGSISVLGQPVRAALKRNIVAYVPQSEDIDWNFPVLVEDAVMMGRYGRMNWLRTAAREDREAVDAALERVGMSEYAGQRAGTLSGGQQQRGAIARAIVQGAEAILADEPVASLDPVAARKVMDLLVELNKRDRLGVVVTLHQVDYALRYCRRVVALKAGKVVYDGPSEGLDRPMLIDIYGPEIEDVMWEKA